MPPARAAGARPAGAAAGWRVTGHGSTRDPAGRLYAAFDKSLAADQLGRGDTIVHDEDATSASACV